MERKQLEKTLDKRIRKANKEQLTQIKEALRTEIFAEKADTIAIAQDVSEQRCKGNGKRTLKNWFSSVSQKVAIILIVYFLLSLDVIDDSVIRLFEVLLI